MSKIREGIKGKNPWKGRHLPKKMKEKILKAHLGEANPMAKLTTPKVHQIHMLFKLNFKYSEIARLYNVKVDTLAHIKNGRAWSQVLRAIKGEFYDKSESGN